MTDAKRSNIKRKVAAAKSRNEARAEPATLADRAGEKAVEAKDKFTSFARQHPIAIVAGGLAAGVLISGLFRGSPTRKAGRKFGRKAAGLAGPSSTTAAWVAPTTSGRSSRLGSVVVTSMA